MEERFLSFVDKLTSWLTIGCLIGFAHIALRFAEAISRGVL